MTDYLCTFENLFPDTAAVRRAVELGTPDEFWVILPNLKDADFEALRTRFDPLFCYSEPVYRVARNPRTGDFWKIVGDVAFTPRGVCPVRPNVLTWPVYAWTQDGGPLREADYGMNQPFEFEPAVCPTAAGLWTMVTVTTGNETIAVWYDVAALVTAAVRENFGKEATLKIG